jgi:putative ABC transport system substrate-binding protein
MKRREFITLLGGAAAAWPLAARAQQALPTIGFSSPTTASVESRAVAAFVQRLHAVGWIEGRAAAIEVRWAEGRSEHAAEIVAKFIRQKVDVIVCRGTASVLANRATSVIPIVFAGGDPVGTGLIVSLARTDGSVTGLSLRHSDLARKRLELLRDVVPALRRLAILGNAGNPVTLQDMREVEVAAGAPDLTVVAVKIWRVEDIAAGFEALKARADMFRA